MKKIISITLLSLFLSFTAKAQTNADMGVAAVGIVVSDIEASEEFYTDVIGMVPAGGFSLDEVWSQEAGAANGKPFSVKVFKMQDVETATMVKLAYFEETPKSPELSGINERSGMNYLTLYYSAEDFRGLLGRLQKYGIEKTGWVKRPNYQLLFVRDPDGNFVELIGPPEN